MKASDIMTAHEVWACSQSDDVRHVAQLMAQHDVGSIPLLDESGRLDGIVTDRDIVLRIVALGRSFETPAREIMSQPVYFCTPDAKPAEIEALMQEHKVRRVPVVDDKRKLLGFISIGDLAKHYHGLRREHHLAEVLEAVSTPVW